MVWDKGKGVTKTDADGVGAARLTPSVADGLISVFAQDIGGTLQPAVDALALHRFLGVKQDFSSWVKRRFRQYGFIEGLDFLLPKMGEAVPLPAGRALVLLALGFFGGFAFPVMGRKKGRVAVVYCSRFARRGLFLRPDGEDFGF
ncbi:antA/AntB antirepressor family protein [Methylovulum psychrotolerans]|uniref:antA/AntB antirepressor family protein n=1 Tax=Methylovulum psychrotolerans TaxID=1704499 RepID=UPI002044D495|nr:antA/AntB antirepressor family protein [Methylovulum psychrotolerans]